MALVAIPSTILRRVSSAAAVRSAMLCQLVPTIMLGMRFRRSDALS